MYLQDNSYAYCITDNKNHYLAGTVQKQPIKIKEILTAPFLAQLQTIHNKLPIVREMIIVNCENNNTHIVLNKLSETPINFDFLKPKKHF